MKIYSNTDELILDVPVTDDSYRYYELGVEDYIECEFHLNELVYIPTGARIGYDGETYTLYIAPQVEKLNDHSYRYTARFEGYMGMLKRYIFHNIPDGRVSFSLTATPAEHLTMILDNMNERDGETSYGKQWRDNDNQCIAADAKTISYDKLNCLEALQLMAAEFETEFEVIRVVKRGFVNNSFVVIDRYYDIVVKKVAYGKDNPLKLSYGRGKGFREDISRVAENESAPVGVMWAKGGDRNINAASYGHTTLQLLAGSYWYADGKLYDKLDSHRPANAQLFVVPDGKNYVQRDGSTNAVEACIDCSDIYPHREGEVTGVPGEEGNDNAYYAIVDSDIPDDLNYDNYKINGQEPTIVFQSGMLAGKEFRINGYMHSDRKFVIAPQVIDGVYMPSDEFPVTAGDKYAIYGISVPPAFITEASRAMLVKAIEELLRVEQPRYLYTGQIDGIWAKDGWTTKRQNLRVGGYIEYDELGAQNTLLRIEAVKMYLNNPYSLELTFGDRSLKPRYRISTLVSTSESMTISAQESSKQQLINASAATTSASLDKAIIALLGSEKNTAEDLTIYGGRAFAKEQADGVLGAKTDVAGKLTVYGTRNYIDKTFSPIIKGDKSLIGLLFFGGRNVSTDIYVPNHLALFDPSSDFLTRYVVREDDKVLNPPNYESAYYVKITTSNYKYYIGAVIAIEVDVTSDEFTDAFGYALHAGDWLVASPYGWKKINGSDVGGSNGVDFEEVKNWVETKLQSYAKMPTEQPIQDSILIYDSDNQTFKGSDVQISTTVQDIVNGEDSKIPTCGQVLEYVDDAIKDIKPDGIQPYFIDEVSISRLIELYGTGHPQQQISEGLYDAVWSAMSQGNPVYIRYYEGVDDSWILLNLVYEDLIYFSCVDASSNIITGELSSDSISIYDITNAIQLKDLTNDLNQDLGELYNIKQDVITDLDSIREGKVYVTRFNLQTLIGGGKVPITPAFVKAMNDKKVILVPYSARGGCVIANVIQCAPLESSIYILLQIYDGAILYSITISSAQSVPPDGVLCTSVMTRDVLIRQTDVKTINGQSILGSGDITISGGGSTLTEDDIANMGFTKNVGTVTSVAGAEPTAEGVISAVLLYNNLKKGQYSSLRGPAVNSILQAGYIYVVDYPVTSFNITTLSATTTRPIEEYSVHFKTSSSGSSFSLPSTVKWAGEKPNTLSPDTYYELNIVKTMISGTAYFKAVLTPFV